MMTDENFPFLESENKLVEPKQVIDDWKAQEKAQSAPYLGNQCHQVHLSYLSLDLNCHFRVGNVQIMDAHIVKCLRVRVIANSLNSPVKTYFKLESLEKLQSRFSKQLIFSYNRIAGILGDL